MAGKTRRREDSKKDDIERKLYLKRTKRKHFDEIKKYYKNKTQDNLALPRHFWCVCKVNVLLTNCYQLNLLALSINTSNIIKIISIV